MLKHHPHTLHIIFSISPIATRIEISHIKLILKSVYDTCRCKGDLARDKRLSTPFTLMIKQNTVYGKHAIAFAVVLRNPEAVLLGHSVRWTRIERSRLLLWHFLHESEQFGRRSLIDACLLLHPEDTYGFQQAKCSESIRVGRIFRHIEAHFHVALCRKIIYFVRLCLLDDPHKRTAVGHITIMQVYQALLLHVTHPLIKVQMLDPSRIEWRRTAKNAMYFVAFFDQKFRQKRTVLSRDACN